MPYVGIEFARRKDVYARARGHRYIGDHQARVMRGKSIVDRGGEDSEFVVEEEDDYDSQDS